MTATHPALHPPGGTHALLGVELGTGDTAKHFVPSGWEEADRGICPCGEVVRWDVDAQAWLADRSLVVLILTADEARHLREDALYIEDLEPTLDLQLALNEADVDDGEVLIAGVLYDVETLQEAHPIDDLEIDTETRHLREQEARACPPPLR